MRIVNVPAEKEKFNDSPVTRLVTAFGAAGYGKDAERSHMGTGG